MKKITMIFLMLFALNIFSQNLVFLSPENNSRFEVGTDLVVNLTSEDRNIISEVYLYINGNQLERPERVEPYDFNHTNQDVELQNLQEGTYEIKAIATYDDGTTQEAFINVFIGEEKTVSLEEFDKLKLKVDALDRETRNLIIKINQNLEKLNANYLANEDTNDRIDLNILKIDTISKANYTLTERLGSLQIVNIKQDSQINMLNKRGGAIDVSDEVSDMQSGFEILGDCSRPNIDVVALNGINTNGFPLIIYNVNLYYHGEINGIITKACPKATINN